MMLIISFYLSLVIIAAGVIVLIICRKKKISFAVNHLMVYLMIIVFIALTILLSPFSWEQYKYDKTDEIVKYVMAFWQSIQHAARTFILDPPWNEWKKVLDLTGMPVYSIWGIFLSIVAPVLTAERLISFLRERTGTKDEYSKVYNSNNKYDVQKDMDNVFAKAKEGDREAMYELANMYFYGIGSQLGTGDRDLGEAAKWFEKLSAPNTPDDFYKAYALKYLSHMYYAGMMHGNIKQSYVESYKYALDSELVKGNGEIIKGHLAFLVSVSSGCNFDFNRVIKLYEEANPKADASLRANLAAFYRMYGKFSEAEKVYQQILEETDQKETAYLSTAYLSAAYELGMIYKKGLHNENYVPDYIQAEKYFRKAANNPNCPSEVYLELGRMYFNPLGEDEPQFEKAQDNFLKAAEKDNTEACYYLGYMYQNGHVEYSLKKAEKYHKIAADKGHDGSMVALANIYQQRECRNYSAAYKYAKMAAESKHSEGCFIYGNLLFLGRGCKPDMKEADKQYDYAGTHGCIQAKFMQKKLRKIMEKEMDPVV